MDKKTLFDADQRSKPEKNVGSEGQKKPRPRRGRKLSNLDFEKKEIT